MANDRSGNEPDRRPTKAERQDEARRQRKEIERGMARRRRNRAIVLGSLAVAAVVAAVAIVVSTGGDTGTANGGSSAPPTGPSLLTQAAAAEKTAGCSSVDTTSDYDPATIGVDVIPTADGSEPALDFAHIGAEGGPVSPPALRTYPRIPPASGPHDPTPLLHGVYDNPPSVQQAIHSLEHGGVIVWYDPNASGPALTELLDFYQQDPGDAYIGQDRIIVAPFDYPSEGEAGALPKGSQMVLVAWHRYEKCSDVNLAAAFNFTAQYATYPTTPLQVDAKYLGEAREPTGSF